MLVKSRERDVAASVSEILRHHLSVRFIEDEKLYSITIIPMLHNPTLPFPSLLSAVTLLALVVNTRLSKRLLPTLICGPVQLEGRWEGGDRGEGRHIFAT